MDSFRMAGNILFTITGAFVLADIRRTLGRLRQAFETYQQALQLAAGQGKYVRWGTADLYTGLSEILLEQNDLEAATEHLLRSKELGEQAALPRWHFRWYLAQARAKEAQGDLAGALDLLNQAERQYVRGPVPDVRPVAALKTRVWVTQGRLAEAQGWVREQGLSPDDNLSYLREFEHITLARVLIAQYTSGHSDRTILDATGLLERLLKAVEEGRRTGSAIEILVLQALAYEAHDNLPLALAPLERALTLAEPEGYVRIFIDQGIPMAHLLSEAARRGIMPDHTRKLLAAFEADQRMSDNKPYLSPIQPLVEPLNQREFEMLQLIAQGLSNREIADRLSLALNTVKGYNRTLYGKLQVHRRTEAIARARELGLL
jgi:LuxR family maltose regulon positive regulatory protein